MSRCQTCGAEFDEVRGEFCDCTGHLPDRSREEKEAGWKRFDAWFEEKPPISNRGVSFVSPPPKNQVSLPFCCQLREQMGILQDGMEEARRRWDDKMYNSNLEDWQELYNEWVMGQWCEECKREYL